MDEFYASTPESSPEKKSPEDPPEVVELPDSPPIPDKPTGAMAKSSGSKGQSKVLPDLVPLFEVQAGSLYGERGQVDHLPDEMVPGVKGNLEPKEKKQKDIRAFFENSPTASPKPKIRSPSPEVMLVDAPRRSISLIDLTKGKKGPSPNRKEKSSAKKRKSNTSDDVVIVKKLPRQELRTQKVSSTTSNDDKQSRSVRVGNIADGSKEGKSSLTSSEIKSLLDVEVTHMPDNKRKPRLDRESRNNVKETKEVETLTKEKAERTKRPNRIGEKRENSDVVALMEAKAFSPEKLDDSETSLEQRRKRVEMLKKEKELEKERSLLAEESDAEPRKLRARQVKETTTEVKCEKKEIAEPKESPKKPPENSSRTQATESKESPRKKVAAGIKNVKVDQDQVKSRDDVKKTKSEPKKEEKPKVKRRLDVEESDAVGYVAAIKIKQEKGEEQKSNAVKIERRVSESPNKLPTYATMIKKALEDMNVVGGEGCTKLEILLYILRKFQPKGNVSVVASKMIKVLEEGTKHGDFLSSVSLPRKMVKKLLVKGEPQKEPQKGEKKKKVKDGDAKDEKKKSKEKKETGDVKSKLKKEEKAKKGGKEAEKDRKEAVQYVYKLKEPLSIICKAKKMTRYEVLRKIWTYIRVKKLQDPKDKRSIICDDNLRKMTKMKVIDTKAVTGFLKPFMEKTTLLKTN